MVEESSACCGVNLAPLLGGALVLVFLARGRERRYRDFVVSWGDLRQDVVAFPRLGRPGLRPSAELIAFA